MTFHTQEDIIMIGSRDRHTLEEKEADPSLGYHCIEPMHFPFKRTEEMQDLIERQDALSFCRILAWNHKEHHHISLFHTHFSSCQDERFIEEKADIDSNH